MSRLRLLAVFLVLGAAPPPPGKSPGGYDPAGDAKAFLPVSCAGNKGSCAEATALLDGYLKLLDEALDCMSKKCTVERTSAFFHSDRKLDEREHRLPPGARALKGQRPFLRLSLFVITAARSALRKADPKAVPPAYTNAAVEASKVVEDICGLKLAKLCSDARATLREFEGLASDAASCEAKACAFPEQERLGVSAERALYHYFAFSETAVHDTSSLFAMLRDARLRISGLLARTSGAKLAELEAADRALASGVDRLERNPAASEGQIDALKKSETAALNLYKDATITYDRTLSLLGGADPNEFASRSRLNASAARLAGSRGKLIALRTARGLGGRKDAGDIVQSVLVEAGRASLGMITLGGRPALGSRPSAPARAVTIDRRAVPIAPPAHPSAPPILKASPGLLALAANTRSKDPLVNADAMRRLGLTSTVGDPSGRAALLHPQKGDYTCAIVAQQQILMAHGLIPKSDPVKYEELLAKEAQDRGFYYDKAGTPRAYQADLLIDRGLLVTKQTAAPLETLDAAVRRGGIILASVDARALWNKKGTKVLGHAILITGAEISRLNGRTLGYYINDSGVDKGGAGRFVPIETFAQAWNPYSKSFAEVR